MNLKDYPNILFTFSKISDGNMTILRGDKKKILNNRKAFLEKIGVDPKRTFFMNLSHTTKIKTVPDKDLKEGGLNNVDFSKDSEAFDGVVTNEKNIFIFMVVGDCLPIAFYNPSENKMCLIHASRMNLEGGILKQTVKQFKNPKDLIVEIGPSIGPCCYHAFIPKEKRTIGPKLKPYQFETPEGRIGIDLWKFTENELKSMGVLPANINNPRICTFHSNQYFSHRKFVEKNLELDSRFAVVLGRKDG